MADDDLRNYRGNYPERDRDAAIAVLLVFFCLFIAIALAELAKKHGWHDPVCERPNAPVHGKTDRSEAKVGFSGATPGWADVDGKDGGA